MSRKGVSGVLVTLLVVSLFTLAFNIQSAGTVACGGDYCWIDGDSLDVGFSHYGEMLNPDEPVGLRYGPVDPFANPNIAMIEWNRGWLMNATYEYKGEPRNVWAYALFSDFRATGGSWICNASGPSDDRPGYRGGRKTNGYAETEPVEVLYDDPTRCIVLLKTIVYDWDIPNPFDPDNPKGLPLVDLLIHVVFDKAEKYMLLINDVKLRSESKMLGTVQVKFGQRGEWDLGEEPFSWMPRSYAHFYHGLPYDLVQIIDQSKNYVAYAAYWPELTSWRVESIAKLTRRDKLTALSDWEQDDMTDEPRTPYTFGEWMLELSYDGDKQSKCVTVFGVSDLTDGDDQDIDFGHKNVIDSEVAFDLLFNPIADFTHTPEKPCVHQEITFNSTSCDEDGNIVSWEWDFNNDGVTDALTENATWTYTEVGYQKVTLTVTDNDGLGDSSQEVIRLRPEHELVVSATVPDSTSILRGTLLSAIVTNQGKSDEVDVELMLYVNDSIVEATTIPLLQAGHSSSLSYLWTPAAEGIYNVTAYAPPVLGEMFPDNNRKTVFIYVRPYWTVDDDGPADFHTIQEAINSPDVKDGDTIYVYSGNYCEDVLLSKSLTLYGEDPNTTIIDGGTEGDAVYVQADHVTITGFTIRNAHREGILIESYHNSTIYNNFILNCGWDAIGLIGSSDNIIESNIMIRSNDFGIWIIDASNNNIVRNNIITENSIGVILDHSNHNTLYGNSITGNEEGILLFESSNNTIAGNEVTVNEIGLLLDGSFNNAIYHNNFVNNTEQADSYYSTNIWDDGYPSGGNYWSDYEERYPDAEEMDGWGLWDTPYFIDETNQDNFPLMEPYSPLPRTIGELKTEIEELGSDDEIDNQGVVISLLAKMDVAQKLIDDGKIDQAQNILNAFIDEVQAQSGKHITPEAADILIESAEHILSNL